MGFWRQHLKQLHGRQRLPQDGQELIGLHHQLHAEGKGHVTATDEGSTEHDESR